MDPSNPETASASLKSITPEPTDNAVVQWLVLILWWLWIVLVVGCIAFIVYQIYKWSRDYLTSKAFSVAITNPNAQVIRVGETIALKLSLSKLDDNGRSIPCSYQQMTSMYPNLDFWIDKNDLKRPVATLISLSPERSNSILIRFSVREAGTYSIFVKTGWFNFMGSPISQEILPGPMLPSRTVLNVPNPTSISLIANSLEKIELHLQDRYRNPCSFEGLDLNKFQFNVKLAEAPIDSSELEWSVTEVDRKLYLNIKISRPNIYNARLDFDGRPVEQSDFTIICMRPEEDDILKTGFKGIFNRLPGPCMGSLLMVGSQVQREGDIWIGVNYKQIAVSRLYYGLIHHPFITFVITRRTRISFNRMIEINENENENKASLKITDGIQASVVVSLKASDARILLATFSHFQSLKLKNNAFGDKVEDLKSELKGFFPYFNVRGPEVIILDRGDVFTSTVQLLRNSDLNWYKPLVITYKCAPPATAAEQGFLQAPPLYIKTLQMMRPGPVEYKELLSTTRWLTIMTHEFFEHSEHGLFGRHGSSRLLHPNPASRRNPVWSLHHYEVAGSILAKCAYESHMNGLCLKLNKLRFTRSFLAQLVGLPVTYLHLKSDDPDYFHKHVKPIAESNDNVYNVTFTEFDESRDGRPRAKINLIPNGGNIPVTKRNKDKYLSVLANHRLKTRFRPEIKAFQQGFYKVIPQGLMADFDEDEVAKLLCSGSQSFEVEDLQNNCRIVGDLINSPVSSRTDMLGSDFSDSDRRKITNWLWTVIGNLSDSEQEELLRLTTGSLVLPSCGFKDLSPRFTIALTGNSERPPAGHPSLHQLSVGNHSSFENFEKNFLLALHGESGSDLPPLASNQMGITNGFGNNNNNIIALRSSFLPERID